ncbi:S8 family peptidase [Roseateles sp. GG27B]
MKYLPVLCVFSLLAALAAPAAHATAALEETARVIVRFKPTADSVRAKALSMTADAATAQDVAQTRATALGLRTGLNTRLSQGLKAQLSLDSRTHVITASGINSAALVQRLVLDSEVELVVVDQRRRHTLAPNDPFYATAAPSGPTVGQWYLKTASSVPGEVVSSINAPSAWDITIGTSNIVVAVLDTGVRKDHPDLAAQFVGGYDMISNAATSGKGSLGRNSDASDPGDYVTQADITGGTLGSGCDATDISNSSWHGTRVSGLIAAASNNGRGMAGVAWGVKILPVRVLGKCGGYDSDIMDGMKWAAGIAVAGLPTNPNPAKVLNLSLGGTSTCDAIDKAGRPLVGALYRDTINQVIAKGATVVVAAGNSEGQAVGLPGNCPGVITVTGLRHVGSKVGFSSVGPEVSIAAPGGNCVNLSGACLYPMFSTTNSGITTPVLIDDAYTNNSASVGTSFSTPIVAGTVALMLSVRPSMTSTEVTAMLQKTARPFVTTGGSAAIPQCVAPSSTVTQDECYCTTSTCGAGMLDAGAAVAAALAANVPIAQSITFTPLATQTLPAGTLTLSASSTSGLSITFSSNTPAICAVSGNSLTLLAAGTCSITASQSGNTSTAAATPVSISFTVAAAPVVVSSGGGGGGAFGGFWVLMLGVASYCLRRPRNSVSL